MIVVGLLSLIPIAAYLVQESGVVMFPLSPPTPCGIGGWVKYSNGTFAPDATTVTAKNLYTDEIVTRNVQNGYFAIPMPARDGDNIQVTAILDGFKAQKIITVDLDRPTQWCNLTFGQVETKTLSWWLLIIPLSLVGMGYYIDKRH